MTVEGESNSIKQRFKRELGLDQILIFLYSYMKKILDTIGLDLQSYIVITTI